MRKPSRTPAPPPPSAPPDAARPGPPRCLGSCRRPARAQSDPDLPPSCGPGSSARAALHAVLAGGALPADVYLELAVDLLLGAMRYRLLNRHAEVNENLAEEMAALLARIR
ncbi:TetR/AcrR family transcriptional regulator C-terminal ligand-binding domain-containing protein [Nonomuraea sp. NPDC050202]|uniref:TetR/AcrR family transcriptional regulator C-terminal ligand-binding domain-containing protein n=1 Tax=Nonomuraea sp. NPDC050202 TaxID=3155035 RepID=UPI0033F4F074